MPELSRFLGIIILMYFNDHNPPHYHVKYNEYRAIIEIETSRILEGDLPPRVFGLVVEWANMHRSELSDDWELLRTTGEYRAISPLV
jgi:hypothetical protein